MVDSSTLFSLLAEDRRRRLLFTLCSTESISIPGGLLTRGGTQVRQDGGPTASRLDQESLQQLHGKLYHSDLPKLEDAHLIEWDQENGAVSRGPEFDEVEPALRLLAENRYKFPD